jgi:hypothetical protein
MSAQRREKWSVVCPHGNGSGRPYRLGVFVSRAAAERAAARIDADPKLCNGGPHTVELTNPERTNK